ncbi:YHB1 [Candida pseudojiufengensis]|uniref:YHB1 n=1 Tax=Candida pseudojiufengensis TaxID=497109 RepID=UPI002225630A|nr:YHB1 [Candida pseudojiufengensis]KAI5962676.1 YHB1 [Candida pseudojiufengensis]
MTQQYQQQELTEKQKELILSTVPILEQAGETLTSKFYNRMLTNYDEVKPFFNETDQKLLRQPKILAFALLNYAKNIRDLTPLTSFVKQIVSKHVGLQVKPQHYPIVGTCLIETMVEILPKDIATPEFIEAWSIAYGNLAALLIDLEANEFSKQPWQDFKNFKITKIEQEASNVKSVYFTPEDGTPLPPTKPGQYVCIRWKLPNSKFEKSREYSISQIPKNNEYRISVKKLPGGLISTYIHEELKVGDTIRVAPPAGNFNYVEEPKEKEMILIAGGIGITPLISIIEIGLKNNRKIKLFNCNKTVDERPFKQFFKSLQAQHPENLEIIEYLSQDPDAKQPEFNKVYNRKFELSDLDFLNNKENDNKDYEIYLLGPKGFMKFIKNHLDKKLIPFNFEYFGPFDVEN